MSSKSPTSITGKARESLARILEHVLKEECFLLARTREYRWSVTGPNLYSLHRLFDEQRHQLDYWLDRVTERTKSIRTPKCERTPSQLSDADPKSSLGLPAHTMIGDLLSRHERIAHRIRNDIERLRDPVTADLLRALVEFHETTAWMLRLVINGSDEGAAAV